MNIKELLKNRFALIAISVSVAILMIVLIVTSKDTATPPPISPTSTLSSNSFELIDLSQEKRNQAMVYVESIENKLPLSVEGFETSVGITTSIHIFQGKNDPAELVRLEIYGLSYVNKNELDEKKNPNVTAFKESFLKAIELLEGQNIDPKRLVFYYGSQDYVRETARTWVDRLKLLQ
jgi:hypothetical protein